MAGTHDAIAQYPDPFNFQFDDIAGRKKAHQLKPASTFNGSGADEFAGIQRLAA